MGALIDVIAEGIKQFGGEIIGGILFAVVLWIFPGLRKFFGRDKGRNGDDTEAETRRQLEILQQEEQQLAYLKEALNRHDEALRQTETQTAEEARQREEAQRQLEAMKKSYEAQSSDNWYNRHSDIIAFAVFVLLMFIFIIFMRDDKTARVRKAAEQGHAEAQFNLGLMYEYGYGVAKNLQEARKLVS
mgnify:CR=1 FL=1